MYFKNTYLQNWKVLVFMRKNQDGHCKCHFEPESSSSDLPITLLPLSEVGPGENVKIVRLDGGRRMCARLAHMGIYPGTKLTIISGGKGTPVIARFGNTTISLGKGASKKILVTKVNP